MTTSIHECIADRIVIRNLELRCVIGVEDWERRMAQRLVVDIELQGDFSAAAESDDISAAVDYRTVCAAASEIAEGCEYRLLETLADRIANSVMSTQECIRSVTVSVCKPLALAGHGTADARVEVTRSR